MEVLSIRQRVVWLLGLGFLWACGEAPVAPPSGSGDGAGGPFSVSGDIVLNPEEPQATDCFGEIDCPIEADEITVTVGSSRVVECIVCEPSGTVGGNDGGSDDGSGGGGGSGGSGDEGGGDEFTDYTYVNCEPHSDMDAVLDASQTNDALGVYAAETVCSERVDDIFHMTRVRFENLSGDSIGAVPQGIPQHSEESLPMNHRTEDEFGVFANGSFKAIGLAIHRIDFLLAQTGRQELRSSDDDDFRYLNCSMNLLTGQCR